jgi:hypothetical protein
MSISNIAQRSNTGISNVREGIDSRAASIVVAPKNAKGIGGWVFDILTRESIDLNAEITDHVVQSGSFLSDHVVIKPRRITLSGLIGENVYNAPGAAEALQELQNKLEVVDAYGGAYTDGMTQKLQGAITQAQTAVDRINDIVNKTQDVIGLLSEESAEKTRQQKLYKDIINKFKNKTLLTVQTWLDYYDNMVIESISATQDETTEQITDISVTLKEVRFEELEFVNYDERLQPPREQIQKAGEEDAGKAQGELASAAYKLTAGE